MTSTFFQRILLLVLLAGCMTGLHAQEYKYEIGGMAGGAFYMGAVSYTHLTQPFIWAMSTRTLFSKG